MLKLEKIKKLYWNNRGLRETSLTFEEGYITAILGRNGSGKTTLLHVILGLLEPDTGTVTFHDQPVRELYDQVAFISEGGSFLPYMNAKQYGDFLASYYTNFSIEDYQKLLTRFEIDPLDKIHTMSKGQQLKLEISAGFAMHAKLIILDEPFTNLDVYAKEDTIKLLIEQLKEDTIILISTHNIEEIEQVADRCLLLDDGLIKADITMDELHEKGMDIRAFMDTVYKV